MAKLEEQFEALQQQNKNAQGALAIEQQMRQEAETVRDKAIRLQEESEISLAELQEYLRRIEETGVDADPRVNLDNELAAFVSNEEFECQQTEGAPVSSIDDEEMNRDLEELRVEMETLRHQVCTVFHGQANIYMQC